MKGNFAAIVLIAAGLLALAVNLGWLQFDLVELLRTWWPLGLVLAGLALFLTPGDAARRSGKDQG